MATRDTAARTDGRTRDPRHLNEVRLVGRLASAVETRALPSGDELATWRLVVDRPNPLARGATVDTLDCAAWTAGARRSTASWQLGDVVEVTGALRRRFWRSPSGGPASRCEVEVHRARRVARAD